MKEVRKFLLPLQKNANIKNQATTVGIRIKKAMHSQSKYRISKTVESFIP
jgi:hypothetical protein